MIGDASAARQVAEAQQRGLDALVRLHFRETPLALASIQRTGICPWPVEVVHTQGHVEVTGQGHEYRVRATAKVVEHERPSVSPSASAALWGRLTGEAMAAAFAGEPEPVATVLHCGRVLDHQGHRWVSAASGITFGCTGQR